MWYGKVSVPQKNSSLSACADKIRLPGGCVRMRQAVACRIPAYGTCSGCNITAKTQSVQEPEAARGCLWVTRSGTHSAACFLCAVNPVRAMLPVNDAKALPPVKSLKPATARQPVPPVKAVKARLPLRPLQSMTIRQGTTSQPPVREVRPMTAHAARKSVQAGSARPAATPVRAVQVRKARRRIHPPLRPQAEHRAETKNPVHPNH